MNKPLELVLIGAGQRGGYAYGSYIQAHPGRARLVALAEPDPERRERVAQEHDIGPERCFDSWEALLDQGQLGDAALVTTKDPLHLGPAVAAMERGYHVLLEKPMADSLAGCVRLVQVAERTGRILQICHVLRYAPFFQAVHDVLASGRLGDIVTVEHRENVAYWHMAHGYVRGNWRREDLSTPMILSKCCHDLDILYWNLGRQVKRLSSTGSLYHFRPDRVGPEIPERCTDGCPIEKECAFSAIAFYLEMRPFRQMAKAAGLPLPYDEERPAGWPFSVLGEDTSYLGRKRALESGPYGRCVYRCDNDVVDHQVVCMEFEGGASVVLVMHGHSHKGGRTMRYDGTQGTLRGAFNLGEAPEIVVHDHASGRAERIPVREGSGGHGGGDWGLMDAFLRALRGEEAPLTNARASLESHLMGFAAEEARRNKTVVEMDEFRARAERQRAI